MQVPVQVVSRVRIPVTLLFEVLKALNTNMTGYESTFGSIRPPRRPPSRSTFAPFGARKRISMLLRKALYAGLYALLAAAATMASRRAASRIWRIATGEAPPAKK